jgi:prevent-host-death family protein
MGGDYGEMTMTLDKAGTIAAGRFKAVCLHVLDEVAQTRTPVTITKRGKPIARLVPVEPPPPLFGALAGTVGDYGDIISPIDAEWDALR